MPSRQPAGPTICASGSPPILPSHSLLLEPEAEALWRESRSSFEPRNTFALLSIKAAGKRSD